MALALTIGLTSCGADGGLGPATSAAPPASEALAVLFIGNSLTYTNSLPEILEQMLQSAEIGEIVVGEVALANYGLEDHWALSQARDLIEQGGWDVVVMQQGPSATEGRPSLLEYSERFSTEIRAAGGLPALYMVWPSEARFFDFDGVSDSYATAANKVGGYLFPAGEAWRAAWRLDEEVPLYGGDGFHPSFAGSYLAALVMYEQLTGLDSRDLPPNLANVGLSTATVETLQEAAAEANNIFALTPVR